MLPVPSGEHECCPRPAFDGDGQFVQQEPGDWYEPTAVRLRRATQTGLNDAILAGLRFAGPHRCRAAMVGDLPFLLPTDVESALREAARHALSVVADREGSGTTLIAALEGVELIPRFGNTSFARHMAAGHTYLSLPPGSTVHWDVDRQADLDAARFLQLGGKTRAALRDITDPAWL